MAWLVSGCCAAPCDPKHGTDPCKPNSPTFPRFAFAALLNCARNSGYQYRLCPSDQDLTEECFQKLPLDFVRGGAKLRFADKTTVPIQGTYVSQGTVPAGSTWAMNPVPARGRDPRHTLDIEFDPPCNESAHNGGGDGVCSGDTARWPKHLGLQVVDTLELPSALATGDYHLQWRWDCEGSAQVRVARGFSRAAIAGSAVLTLTLFRCTCCPLPCIPNPRPQRCGPTAPV